MTDRGRMALVQFLDRLVPRTRAPASKEQGDSENEQTSDFHVNLLADLAFFYKSVLLSENAEPQKLLG